MSGASTPRAELTTGLKCLTECMTSISRVALWHLVGITTSRTLTERSPSIILIALRVTILFMMDITISDYIQIPRLEDKEILRYS